MRGALAASVAALVACTGGPPTSGEQEADTAAAGETLSETARTGPVSATVSVTPSEPRLGDTMRLELRVEAEAGVDVEMPIFGEALGRFTILGFTPREETGEDGRRMATQDYRLQAASSGRLRIPPLRITFVDRRPGQAGDAGPGERELLTPELPVHVQSVLPGEEDTTLRPPRPELDPDIGPSWLARHGWAVAAGCLVLLAAGGLLWRARGRRRVGPVESPYDRARRRLSELEARGVPEADGVDDWYVELSAIVRRYLEDRFALRAPELTTEEFLRVAQRSDHLRAEHKALLAEFLAGCDRVKFAGYRPGSEESEVALASAHRFLDDTRPGAADGEEASS